MLKGNARSQNGTHRKARPICTTTLFSLSKRTNFKCVPPSLEGPGCQLSGNRIPLHPPHKVLPARVQQWFLFGTGRARAQTSPPAPLREGVMGSRSRPGRGLPKTASLTSAGLLPPSQSLFTLMCTIKWLCLHSQKLARLGSLREGSSTLPGQQISKVFYLISS